MTSHEKCCVFSYLATDIPFNLRDITLGISYISIFIGLSRTGESGYMCFGTEEHLEVILDRLQTAFNVYKGFTGKDAHFRIYRADELGVASHQSPFF